MAYLKAIVAAVIAALSSLVVAFEDTPATTSEWMTAIISGLVAFGAVYFVPNQPTPPQE